MAMVILLLVFVTVVIFHHWWRNRNVILTNWPMLGMLPGLMYNTPRLHEFMTELMTKSGGAFEFKGPLLSGMDFILTSHPSNLQHMYTTKFSNYPKGEEFREVLDLIGDGILNVDSELWRLQRKMFQLWTRTHANFDSFVATTLHRKVVDYLIPFLNHASDTKIEVDIQDTLQRMITFDNAILFIFGLDLTAYSFKSPKHEYQKAFNDMQEAAIHRHIVPKCLWKLQRWLNIGIERRVSIANQIFDEFIYQCISLKREQIMSQSKNHDLGLLSIYMKEKEKPYSDKFLRDVAFSFLAAARDTLNVGLCWFFWFVATHPNIETKIINEMKEKLGTNYNNLDYDYYKSEEVMSKLVYLQATIYETFRLYPSVPFNHRTSTKEDVFPSGQRVKANQMVLTCAYATGRMEEVWGKDCLEFKPERWISEKGEFVFVPSHKFPAFHVGPRTCLGKDMALVQMKVMALTLLKNYRFHVVEGHHVCPRISATISMKYGLKIRNIGYLEGALGGAVMVYFLATIHHWWRDRNAVLMAWPVVGMLPKLLLNASNVHDFATEILRKSGGTFVFKGPSWFTTDLDFIITCDPSNLQHILNSNFSNYPKGEEFRQVFDVLGDGILNVDSDLWRLQRKMFQLWSTRHKNFVSFIANTMHHKMVDHFIPFLHHLSQTRLQVDLQESFQRMITFDNAILLSLGLNPASHSHLFQLPQLEYQKAFEDIHKAVFQRHILPQTLWKLQRWLKIGAERKLAQGREMFDQFMLTCISLKQQQLMITNNNNENNDDEADFEELNKFIYLQAVLYETFRLYPPIPFNHRSADKDDILPSGHHVRKKQRVLLSFYSTGRMEEIWGKDCLEFKPERWITEEKVGRPVFGMWPNLLRNIPRLHDFATEFLRQRDLTIEFKGPWFANLDFIITCDPRNIQHILITNFANYPKGPQFKEAFEALGDGILNVDLDLWRLQRKMFQLWSRQHKKFDSFVSRTIQQKVVNDLIPFLDQVSNTRTQIDLQEAFQSMVTFESAILLIFGLDPDNYSFTFSKLEYRKAIDDIQEATLRRHFLPEVWWKLERWLQVGHERKLTKARRVFDEFMYQCIQIKRKELYQSCKSQNKEQVANSNDLMTLYMEEKEKPYSDQFLKDVALNFVAAARDTLTAGLSWFFYLVATHPIIEAKILEEMKENLPTVNDDNNHNKYQFFDAEELSKLVYLQAVLYETLRLYPSVPLNHKTVAEPDILPSGHRVERKTRIFLSYYAMGRMEKIWGPDCLEFKPERWISEQGGFVYVPSHKYTVFNAGPRSCLGKDMALLQMKVLATTILSNFRLQVVEGHPVSPNITVTLNMKHGLKVWVSRRCA
ncbi:hypothetical protein F8388_010441 [Cannabis sativa]|uniref:Cytochrome P450 n=1 Tax=Cannabis sativa TaxID=3483 RepID=A0A7J6GSK0_CANSA|nr:hypothetical protein F8388_010441 [Cannabis sativa]